MLLRDSEEEPAAPKATKSFRKTKTFISAHVFMLIYPNFGQIKNADVEYVYPRLLFFKLKDLRIFWKSE